jgi:phosphate starvation-inducible PhoH-like protein
MGRTRKGDVKMFNEHLTPTQRIIKNSLKGIVVATFNGKGGSGKTSLAINYAMEQLSIKEVSRVVITRPTAMRKKHDMGFLTGDSDAKLSPWMRPIFDSIHKLYPPTGERDKVQELMKEGKLEIVSMAHIQGLTFDNAVVIVDEYQNLDDKDLEGLLTRIGKNCKMIFAGDFRQSLVYNSGIHTLNEACDRFDEMESFWFEENFRHPIVEKIIDFYEEKVVERQNKKEESE